MAAFSGFADPSCKFWKNLAKHQDKAFYEAHKAEHKEAWEAPMKALLEELRDKLDSAYPDCDLAEPKLFRIHRDVRFSKDKSPYKTNVSGCLYVKAGAGSATSVPAPLYVQIGTNTFSGAGLYMMDPAQLAKFRAAVLDDKKGKELSTLVTKLEKAGYEPVAHDKLKKVPRGVDPEHPRAELLKMKGLTVTFPKLTAKEIGSREIVSLLTQHGKKVAPLVRWLTYTVL
ncbi:MAG: DUF2461 domain-containing protein [Polyangiaceae bacterium]|nr:DUF2461 domain-containing protein [Polyangiaceae bacterium]